MGEETSHDGSVGNPDNGVDSARKITVEEIEGLSPEQAADRWDQLWPTLLQGVITGTKREVSGSIKDPKELTQLEADRVLATALYKKVRKEMSHFAINMGLMDCFDDGEWANIVEISMISKNPEYIAQVDHFTEKR